ncbi:Mrp/NBP35 family ATP-binding protein [Clostridium fallax]|uniref:Iron-sulfur cluster carrier protein n=1 Tax=Clostridium fallax TaxID=1533 RepID=A0A1M4TC11_9CLOT|nr:Mrp/NBP35 family ATP-binding protein [Clostridium fallax]SHE41787.1 Chromosome partitioning ATPase, Mrp family, contains Fe-S cluster [Clostridium fallax]SQB22686.1 Mrp protein [Clostridium fallax]
MSNCSTCASKDSCASKGKSNLCVKVLPKYGNVKNIIGVISGKGGVGKSTVTGILATQLAKKGYKVGVLDADITGPSMPRFFGINKERAKMVAVDEKQEKFKFIPVETKRGIKVISMNLLTPDEDQPVIWRGPVITGVLNQMYEETDWGDLDYLLIDMPPGTGDTALTVMQSFPLKEIIMVSTPQDMVSMIVKKVAIMAEKMGVPVRGVVENMAYIVCEDCGKKIKVFSKKSSEEHAEYLNLPLLCELPINLDLTEALEQGKAEEYVWDNGLYEMVFGVLY